MNIRVSDKAERLRQTNRVTVIGAIGNLGLAIGKVIAGYLGNSQALIADGIHSASDLASDALVLVAARHAAQEADEDHPYGHERFETLAGVALGILLVLVGLGIALDAGRRIFSPETLLIPGMLALGAAFVSILAKEWMYQFTVAVARRVRSKLLEANAWHHRSDAISSIVVMLGVGGAMAGFPYLDAVAAIAVAVMVARIGADIAWNGVQELVDTGLDPERLAAIRERILEVDGVASLHMLKTRRMGNEALAEVHILVDPRLSVSEGHQIGESVRAAVMSGETDVRDVMVHVDPEDDEAGSPNAGLPCRTELLERLHDHWQHLPDARRVEDVVLHYLGGQVYVDLMLPRAAYTRIKEVDEVAQAFSSAAREVSEVAEVRVLLH